ncbi:MAG: hypothetical protein R6V86_09450 [Spirochaetia bacterium]
MRALKIRRLQLFTGISVLLLAPAFLAAEVTIVRSLPESGTNQAEASWKRPSIPVERPPAAEVETASRLSGRVIVGGSGSGTTSSASIEDWSTDSQVNYRSYLGQNGLMDIQAQAFRDTGIDSFTQRYLGSLAYSTPSFSMKLAGNYDQNESIALDGQSLRTAGGVGLNIATSDEVRYPFQLQYSSSWDQQEYEDLSDDELEERQRADHSMSLSSELPLGMLRLNLDGGFDIHHDRLEDVSTRGYGGTLGASFPLSPVIGLYAGVSPHYSETEQQISEEVFQERSLGSDAGFLLSFSERLEGEIHALREDTWRSDPDSATEELFHTEIWKGSTEWSLIAPEELTTTAEYLISRAAGGNVSHDLAGDSVWEQEEGLLRRAGAEARLLVSNAESATVGDGTRESLRWGSFLVVAPADGMKIDTKYAASRSEDEDSDTTQQHNASSDYSHTPMEGFSYGLAAAYAYHDSTDESSSTYSGNGRVNLSPVFGYRRLDLGVAELFELEDEPGGQNLLSKSSFSSSIPLTKQFKLRYLFSWEWVDLAAEGAAEGSAFQHSAGFSVGGSPIPFRMNSNYLVGHGFRGLQHQVDAQLDIPLRESFSVISKFSYRYAENVEYETPFLFSTFAHYEF